MATQNLRRRPCTGSRAARKEGHRADPGSQVWALGSRASEDRAAAGPREEGPGNACHQGPSSMKPKVEF